MKNLSTKELEKFAAELNLDEVVEAIENNSPAKVDSFTGLSLIDVLNAMVAEQFKTNQQMERTNQLMERIAIALETK